MSLEAVLFDMDGLLLDTERIQMHCWQERLAKDGININREAFVTTIGGGRGEMQAALEKSYGGKTSFETLMAEKNEILYKYIEENGIPIKKGATQLLDFLDEKGIRKFLVTSTHYERACFFLETTGLLNRFEAIIAGGVNKKSKPSPDLYLECLERAGLTADECIALEDSINGIKSCEAAKTKVIAVPDLQDIKQDLSPFMIGKLKNLVEVKDFIDNIL